jgi:hypothetical protein
MMDSDPHEAELRLLQLLEELRELLAGWVHPGLSQVSSSLLSFYAARRSRLSS